MPRTPGLWKLALCVAVITGCERRIEGPSPIVSRAVNPLYEAPQPAQVCNAQAPASGWTLHLDGQGFAPLPVGVLGNAEVAMPQVLLSGPETFELPREQVAFVSSGRLTLTLPTADTTPPRALATGSYGVTVRNPSGLEGSAAGVVVVVPPPTLASATDEGTYSQGAAGTLRLTGTGFRTADVPGVVLRGGGLAEVTITEVTVVSATEVTGVIPAGTAPGTYDVVLTNPEGCAATLPAGLVLSDLRLGALRIDPRFGYRNQNTTITVYNAPVGNQQAFSGGAPQLTIHAPLRSDPSVIVAIPLRRESYVSANAITAVVPTCSGLDSAPASAADCPNGIVAGGPYAVSVRDPSGATGTIPASAGFVVLFDPAPQIQSISPPAVDTQGLTGAEVLTISGEHFGENAVPQIVAQLGSGNLLVCDLPLVLQAGTNELQANLPTSVPSDGCAEYDPAGAQVATSTGFSLTEGQYLIRVQNGSDIAYSDFSALVVRNPSADPESAGALATRLSTARADFRLVQGRDDLGSHFLYAVGGSDGSAVLASVEVAPVTPFGDLGGDCSSGTCRFRILDRTPLPEGRSGHGAFSYTDSTGTSWLYVVGGSSGPATLDGTLRAQILRAADAPDLTEPEPAAGTLPQGTWYYRVAAVMAGDDPVNPGGETLASDEQPHTVPAEQGGAALRWRCVPGAASYRVYRTAEANAASGGGVLLTTLAAQAACSGDPLPDETFTDDGSLTAGSERPLPPGALGQWVAQAPLRQDRAQAGLERVGDILYVAGGYCAVEETAGDGLDCPADNATLATVERAGIDPATGALGAFEAAGTLNTARRRLHLTLANADAAPAHFSSSTPDNRADAWLVAVGGRSATTTLTTNVFEVAQVVEDGAAIATPAFTVASYAGTQGFHGGWAYVVANQLVGTAANSTNNLSSKADDVCVGQCTAAGSFAGTLNNTKITAYTAGLRYLNGNLLFRAFIYVAGGFPTTTVTGTPTDTLERFTY